MNTPPKCGLTGCGNTATKTPVISFASKAQPRGARATMRFPVPVCDEHAIYNASLFVSDEGWAQIEAGFKARGVAAPDRRTLLVSFDELPKEYLVSTRDYLSTPSEDPEKKS